MSFDLAVWKRSETTKTAMLVEVYEAICDDRDHPAMARFDLVDLRKAMKREFGDYESTDEPEIMCETGSGAVANWMIVHCAHSAARETLGKLVPIALERELLVYDPQVQSVYGNKRPESLRKPKKR